MENNLPILVQKYGGSSLATSKQISAIAKRISVKYQEGNKVVVIVSAMGKTTDELIELANEREDVRVIFLQHPILSESSVVIAKMVIAANYEQKGFALHDAIFTIPGSLNKEKLNQAIRDVGLNTNKIRIDIGKNEIEKIVEISSFLAGGIGARGTPSIFINENFSPGYISKERIINLLK